MASTLLIRSGRQLTSGAAFTPSLFAAHKNAAAPLAAAAWQHQQTRQLSDSLLQVKSGRGGRSSFTGNVVTVFGPTGFIGRYIINRLAKEGNQVIIAYRGDATDVRKFKVAGDLGQILFVPIDVKNQASLDKAVKYSNWTINLIGRDWETKNFSFFDVHCEAARAIAKACKDAGVDKFIHFSALNASPNPQRCLPSVGKYFKRFLPKAIPQTSASFLPNGSQFLRSKYAGELAVREEFPEAIIMRPSDVMGHDDRFLRYLNNKWRRSYWNAFPFWRKGEQTIKAPVSVHDIASAVMFAFKNKHSYGQTYQCAGPEFYRMDVLIDYFLDCTLWDDHRRVDLLTHPKSWPTLAICLWMELLWVNRPLYTWEKFEREAISDVVVDDLPTIRATLPKGHQLLRMEQQAPYEIRLDRKELYEVEKQHIPDPPPPTPYVFPDD